MATRIQNFFTSVLAIGGEKYQITEIYDHGKKINDPQDIQKIFLDYYSSLLGNQNEGQIKAIWHQLYPENPPDPSFLDAKILEEEIKDALFSLAEDKLPGPEGFPASFYQRFREIIKVGIFKNF